MYQNTDVYLMESQSEEVIAHAFAKTSRSPNSFSDMVKELNEAKSSAFHEKWVLKFGHNSVSEHAMLHMAIEGASRLAIEALESCRLASYTEQSTRYQPMTADAVYRDSRWPKDFASDYDLCIQRLFTLYDLLVKNTKSATAFKSPYDLARFALPLSTRANVGMTINARALRRTLCKMLASKYAEVVELAQKIQEVAERKLPTLLKYVSPCRSIDILGGFTAKRAEAANVSSRAPFSVRLLRHNIDIAAIAKYLFYEVSDREFGDTDILTKIVADILSKQGWHDANYRALEMGTMELEIESDYGTFYDIKRHRMLTLIPQKNIGKDGYIIPYANFMRQNDLYDVYVTTMNFVFDKFSEWSHIPDAIYMLPNAARCRYVIQMNPRQSFALVKLRGLHMEGHSSYRTVGLKILEMCKDKWPELYSWLDKFNQDGVSSYVLEKEYELIPSRHA